MRIFDYAYTLMRGEFLSTLRPGLIHKLLSSFLPMRLGQLTYPILMRRYFAQEFLANSVTLVCICGLDLLCLVACHAGGSYLPQCSIARQRFCPDLYDIGPGCPPVSCETDEDARHAFRAASGRSAHALDNISEDFLKSMRI